MESKKGENYRTLLKKALLKKVRAPARKDPDLRIKSGIPGFDNASGGGYLPGTLCVVAGCTGSGKSVFCLQSFLSRKFTAGERGVIVSFFEDAESIKEKARSLGLPINSKDTVLDVEVEWWRGGGWG